MPEDKSYDVVGLGCCAFDIVAEVDSMPGPDDKVGVKSIRTQGGGLVATGLPGEIPWMTPSHKGVCDAAL